jgi:hypothetical protein
LGFVHLEVGVDRADDEIELGQDRQSVKYFLESR